MARDFTKNTSNYMSCGLGALNALITDATIISVHLWIQADSFDATNNKNRMFTIWENNGNTGLAFLTDNASHLRVGGRTFAEGFQFKDSTTAIATSGAWTSCGGVYTFPPSGTGGTIQPYLNGVAEGGGSVSFNNPVWNPSHNVPTTSADTISGNGAPPTGTDEQTDGRLAELAIWTNVDIGAESYVRLAKQRGGNLALRIFRSNLVFFMPLYGVASPETSIISSVTGTITGTVAAAAHVPYANVDQVVGL